MRTATNRYLLFTLAALLCSVLPATAFATSECSTNADCGEGYVCETRRTPCTSVYCPPDEDCPDTSCEPEEVSECRPAPPDSCTTTADCDSGLLCVTYTWETCSNGSNASCTTESEGYCLPPYLAPCGSDAHCGTGFSCVEAETCDCTGGGGTQPADAGIYDPGAYDAGSHHTDAGSDGPYYDTGGTYSDAGSYYDTGYNADAGSYYDTGTYSDAGSYYDSGYYHDTGTYSDAGSYYDSGYNYDTGHTYDTGHAYDAGSYYDTGSYHDAGTVIGGTHDAGSASDAGAGGCTCAGSGKFYCELEQTACTSDADCAGDLICDQLPWAGGVSTACTSEPGGTTRCGEDGGSGQEAPTYCQPADLGRWAALGAGTANSAASMADEHAESGGSSNDGGESSRLVSTDVDRGGAPADSNGSSESGAACASTGLSGSVPLGAAGALFGLFGLLLMRIRSRR